MRQTRVRPGGPRTGAGARPLPVEATTYLVSHPVSGEPLDAQRAIVHGLLALRGVSREVALEVRLNGARRHPLPPFRRTVGFSATATLSRADFGITAWRSMIGDTVELRIEAEATRVRGTDAGEDAGSEPADAPAADAAEAAEAAEADDAARDRTDPPPIPEPEPRP